MIQLSTMFNDCFIAIRATLASMACSMLGQKGNISHISLSIICRRNDRHTVNIGNITNISNTNNIRVVSFTLS